MLFAGRPPTDLLRRGTREWVRVVLLRGLERWEMERVLLSFAGCRRMVGGRRDPTGPLGIDGLVQLFIFVLQKPPSLGPLLHRRVLVANMIFPDLIVVYHVASSRCRASLDHP